MVGGLATYQRVRQITKYIEDNGRRVSLADEVMGNVLSLFFYVLHVVQNFFHELTLSTALQLENSIMHAMEKK